MEDINKILNNIVNPNTVSVSNCVLFGFNTHIKDKEKYSNKLIIAEDNEILAECELSKRAYEVLNRSISETENGYKIALLRALKQLQEKGKEELMQKVDEYSRECIIYRDIVPKNSQDFTKEMTGFVFDVFWKIRDWQTQQTTLAYNTGKADMLDTVLKEIEETKTKYIEDSSPLGAVINGYVYRFNQALDALKTKLTAKEQIIR